MATIMYGKLPDGRIGIWKKYDTRRPDKYGVIVKGDTEITYSDKMDAGVNKEMYDMYDPKPVKQPAKRGGKK